MIGEAMRSGSEFGIVQAHGRGIVNMGCTATVTELVRQYPDGRMDIVLTGRRRFEILELDDELPYLRGAVKFFDDEPVEDPALELRCQVLEYYRQLRAALNHEQADLPSVTHPQLSFAVADAIADLTVRQLLLATRSEKERLERLAEYFPRLIQQVKRGAQLRQLAARNGHGGAH